MCKSYCYATISDCAFISNAVSDAGVLTGGGIAAVRVMSPYYVAVNNCIVSGNFAAYGGGMGCYAGIMVVSNNIIARNRAGNRGGGVYVAVEAYAAKATLVNSSLIGNMAQYWGGGVCAYGGRTLLKNCTITGNALASVGASYRGGAFYVETGHTMGMTNCIVWDNTLYPWRSANSTSTVAYCDIDGGLGSITSVVSVVNDGGGNINVNPLFADRIPGRWTADGVYDPTVFKTTLTDTNAAWTPGEHIGKTIVVNTVYPLGYQSYIAANTATTLTVWGAAQAMGTKDAYYQIVDIHEKSVVGRWTRLGWVLDAVHSPCIDAGDAKSVCTLEPHPNGGLINMGRYGNTAEASKGRPIGTLTLVR